jgi:hypothetical protein
MAQLTLEPYLGRPERCEQLWHDLTEDQPRTIIADHIGKATVDPAMRVRTRFDPSRVVLRATTLAP